MQQEFPASEKKNAGGTYYYYMSSVTMQRLAEVPTRELAFRRGVDVVRTHNLFVLGTTLYPGRCVGGTRKNLLSLLLPLVVRLNLRKVVLEVGEMEVSVSFERMLRGINEIP